MKIIFNDIKDNANTSLIFKWLKEENLDHLLSNNIIKNSDIFITTENDLDTVFEKTNIIDVKSGHFSNCLLKSWKS